MPTAAQILAGVTSIVAEWRALAIFWHAVVAILLVLMFTRRITRGRLAMTLATMMASVSAMAWWSGNWFNAAVFAALAVTMAWQSRGAAFEHVVDASRRWVPLGVAALAFGWFYPHFLEGARVWDYAYAAPMGLIPCPTLAAAIGLSLIGNLVVMRRWGITLGVAGLIYGVIGVARLGVSIDVWLITAALAAITSTLMTPRATAIAAARPRPPAPGIARA